MTIDGCIQCQLKIAVGKSDIGFFPPNSSDNFLSIGQPYLIFFPVTVPPVNDIAVMSGAHNRLPCLWSKSVNDIKDTLWKSSFDAQFRQHECSHGKFRRLSYNGTASCKRRSYLPGEQVKRKIPWRNTSGYSRRRAQSVVYGLRPVTCASLAK